MNPLTPDQIRGTWATLLLPINEDETIDFGRLADEIDVLIAARPNGIYSNGTACEFFAQTEEEFDRVSAMLAERCEAANVPFQIGASCGHFPSMYDRVRRAAAMRPGAIQVILPDWFPVTDEEAIDALGQLAEVSQGIGLVLYNPPHAKRELAPQAYRRLRAAVPALVGVKVAGGGVGWYDAMREYAKGLSIFVPGHILATGLALGAAGSYSNVACLSPIGAQRWYDLMQRNPPAALDIERRLGAFFTRHIFPLLTEHGYSNPAADKLLAAIGDWFPVGTRLRQPYRWIPLAEADRLRPVARAMLPELFP